MTKETMMGIMHMLNMLFEQHKTQSLMSRVCWQLFGQSISTQPNALCQKWFTDALNHCSNQFLLVDASRPSFASSVWSYLRGKSHAHHMNETMEYRTEPFMLDRQECKNLIYSVNQDYLNMYQNVRYNSQQNETLASVSCTALLLILGFLLVIRCTRRCRKKSVMMRVENAKEQWKMTDEDEAMQCKIHEFVKTHHMCPKLLEALFVHYGTTENVPCECCSSRPEELERFVASLTYQEAATSTMPPSKIPIPLFSTTELHRSSQRAQTFRSEEPDICPLDMGSTTY